jgi:hypothetical protein
VYTSATFPEGGIHAGPRHWRATVNGFFENEWH